MGADRAGGARVAVTPRTSRDGRSKDGSDTVRVRLARIVAHLLEHRRATRSALEVALGVNERQVRADLAALVRVGFVHREGTGRSVVYAVHAGLLQRALPQSDQLALLVGQQVTRFLDGTPLHRADEVASRLSSAVRYLPEPSRTYAPHGALVSTCLEAVLRNRALRPTYDGPSGARN